MATRKCWICGEPYDTDDGGSYAHVCVDCEVEVDDLGEQIEEALGKIQEWGDASPKVRKVLDQVEEHLDNAAERFCTFLGKVE